MPQPQGWEAQASSGTTGGCDSQRATPRAAQGLRMRTTTILCQCPANYAPQPILNRRLPPSQYSRITNFGNQERSYGQGERARVATIALLGQSEIVQK